MKRDAPSFGVPPHPGYDDGASVGRASNRIARQRQRGRDPPAELLNRSVEHDAAARASSRSSYRDGLRPTTMGEQAGLGRSATALWSQQCVDDPDLRSTMNSALGKIADLSASQISVDDARLARREPPIGRRRSRVLRLSFGRSLLLAVLLRAEKRAKMGGSLGVTKGQFLAPKPLKNCAAYRTTRSAARKRTA